jgi:hypothetical protein
MRDSLTQILTRIALEFTILLKNCFSVREPLIISCSLFHCQEVFQIIFRSFLLFNTLVLHKSRSLYKPSKFVSSSSLNFLDPRSLSLPVPPLCVAARRRIMRPNNFLGKRYLTVLLNFFIEPLAIVVFFKLCALIVRNFVFRPGKPHPHQQQ